jgi:hypothetical protein
MSRAIELAILSENIIPAITLAGASEELYGGPHKWADKQLAMAAG